MRGRVIFIGLAMVAISVFAFACDVYGGYDDEQTPTQQAAIGTLVAQQTVAPLPTPRPVGYCVKEIASGEVELGDRMRITPVKDSDGKDQGLNLIANFTVLGTDTFLIANAARGPHYRFLVNPASVVPGDQLVSPIIFGPAVGMVGRLIDVTCGEVPILYLEVSFWDLCHQVPDAIVVEGKPLLDVIKTDYRVDPCNIGGPE